MKRHPSDIFLYDKASTILGYSTLDYRFTNPNIKSICVNRIIDAMTRNSIDVGIDFHKPWEEIILDEKHYQIEYLFVGKLIASKSFISDTELGINIYTEDRFRPECFNSHEILNLTLVIEK